MKNTMIAAVIERFGDANELSLKQVPIPEIDDNEVLIRLKHAGIGHWDAFEREGGYAKMLGLESSFPYILGSEGSGIIASVGQNVTRFKNGDNVYAAGFLNPKGGFYAEYVAVNEDFVSLSPKTYSSEQAAVFSGVGLTALRGLVDVLKIKAGESIAIVGASGGVGHIAVQIAKRIGARVFAIASGEDGVTLVRRFGIDSVVNGRDKSSLSVPRFFGADKLDAVLLTTGSEINDEIISHLATEGRVAYPFGIFPEPLPHGDIVFEGYNGEPDKDIIGRLNAFAEYIIPHVDKVFPLDQVVNAHQQLSQHYLGKLALKII